MMREVQLLAKLKDSISEPQIRVFCFATCEIGNVAVRGTWKQCR